MVGQLQGADTMPSINPTIERPPYPESTWYAQPWYYWSERSERWRVFDIYLKSNYPTPDSLYQAHRKEQHKPIFILFPDLRIYKYDQFESGGEYPSEQNQFQSMYWEKAIFRKEYSLGILPIVFGRRVIEYVYEQNGKDAQCYITRSMWKTDWKNVGGTGLIVLLIIGAFITAKSNQAP